MADPRKNSTSVREQVTKEEKQWIGNRIITNLTLGKQPAGNSMT